MTDGALARLIAALCLAATLAATGARAQSIDETPRIAVVSAYEPEWTVLQEALTGRTDHTDRGVRFVTGRMEGQDVVLVLSGISMVNAAMTTQMLLDRFSVSAIVVSGIAGGVDPALEIGDVVVAERWGQYLNAVYAREVAPGEYAVPPFFDAPFANFGMIHPIPVEVRREGEEAPQDRFWFDVDAALLAAARRAEPGALARCAGETCLASAPRVVFGGNGVSGAAFVDNAQFRAFVEEAFAARVLDMETAAIAHVAFANGVPFIAFRSLSDLAGGEDEENELPTFFALAAQNSAAVVRAMLAAL